MKSYSLIFILCAALFSGCVTQKKYDELLANKVKLEAEKAELEGISQNQKADLEKTRAERDDLAAKYAKSSKELDSLQKEHTKLSGYYDNLLNNSGKLNRDLKEQRDQLLALEENLSLSKARNEELAANLAEREKRVSELERILEEKDKAVNALKQKVSEALLSFKENDLTVEIRNGKVYVSLAEQLLFKSGSTKVDPKGVSALQQLAKAVKDNQDINILVEGHTDNVPIGRTSQYMNDNWDLSVMRATSIVRILTESGVSPAQVTASGRGEVAPITDNTSAEGRQKNRRTEIILTPKLDELFQILESN
ncbi:OmpA family protein [Cytophagales bacterium LB-30]|uniref:OmpA family protein n=1 Tax=Shiella aurantiaca TaxID=3058365 RepID=A0ABT8F7B8_9BACT|nr:OmpA family protein [Shiella aurantiaca]MDN4166264.1 OmpA family protein [Shiella aurantiaca]